MGLDDQAIKLVPRPFALLGDRGQQRLEQRGAPQLVAIAAVDGAVGRIVVIRVVAGTQIIQLTRGAVGEAGIPVEHHGGFKLAAGFAALAVAGGQVVAEAFADGAPVCLVPQIRHYVMLHRVAELVPDHHGILGIGHAAATQLQPAFERIVEGVVLIAGLGVDVERPRDKVAKAEVLEVALGQIQVVVGVDVGKAAIIAGQAKPLRAVGAEGGGIRLHGIHHPGVGAAQQIASARQGDRQRYLVLIGGVCQLQGFVPHQTGVAQLGTGIRIEYPSLQLGVAGVGGAAGPGGGRIHPAAELAAAVTAGEELHIAGLGVAGLMLAYPLAQSRHQGVSVAPVPGFDRTKGVDVAAAIAQLLQQWIQSAGGVAAGFAALQRPAVVIDAPGLACLIDADGGLDGGHRQAVDQLAEAVVMAEQAGPLVVGGQAHAKALFEPLLGCGGQRLFIDKLQFGRQQWLGEQGCRQPEGQGRGFHGLLQHKNEKRDHRRAPARVSRKAYSRAACWRALPGLVRWPPSRAVLSR